MPHLTLANARTGALRITHSRYPDLRLRTQFGRAFVLSGRLTLAAGTDWESALENLTVGELQKFVQRHDLVVPADTPFLPLADLYLNDPDKLVATYRRGAALVAELPPQVRP